MKNILLALAGASIAVTAGCATPQNAGTEEVQQLEGTVLTGSRLPRKDKGGPEYTKVIVQDGMSRAEEINRGTVNIDPRGK